jgi:four helix bundle protein
MDDEVGETGKSRYDLEERTANFGERTVRFAKRIPINAVTEPLIRQLVRSSASVGANYCEAGDAGSKKEFLYRISICKRESRETKHWLRVVAAGAPDLKGGTIALARGQGASPHLRFHPPWRSWVVSFRHWGFGIPWSFDIRHSALTDVVY